MRVELAEGQYADLRDRLTYGQARDIRAAFLRIKEDPSAAADIDLALVRGYVSEWHVLSLSGEAVPSASPDLAPDDVIQTISLAAIAIWQGKPDPKDTPEPSPTTQPAQP